VAGPKDKSNRRLTRKWILAGNFRVARNSPRIDTKRGDRFPEADFRVLICTVPILDYFRIADHPPGIGVSLQVEHKQFIGNGHLIGSQLR